VKKTGTPQGNDSTLSRFFRRENQLDVQSFDPLALGNLPFREISADAFNTMIGMKDGSI